MSKHLDELVDGLAESLHGTFAEILGAGTVPRALIEQAVLRATEGWSVHRKDYPHTEDHPLAEVHYGHQLIAALPFVPETDTEREDREAWMAAQRWARKASWYSWDPQDPGWDDNELGPPPQRVGAAQLLKQGIWWRTRTSEDEFAPTVPIRIEHMDHEHRLALLAFLRRNAPRYKLRADWAMAGGPRPDGDMACDAFEDACNEQWNTPATEWIEDQSLVQALVYWTTPYAESPLTWRPMNEAPLDGTVIMARWADALSDAPEHQFVKVYWSSHLWDWLADEGTGVYPLTDELVEWRELRDDEATPFTFITEPEQALCEHGVDHNAEHCLYCEGNQDDEDAAAAEHANGYHLHEPEPHRCPTCRDEVTL